MLLLSGAKRTTSNAPAAAVPVMRDLSLKLYDFFQLARQRCPFQATSIELRARWLRDVYSALDSGWLNTAEHHLTLPIELPALILEVMSLESSPVLWLQTLTMYR